MGTEIPSVDGTLSSHSGLDKSEIIQSKLLFKIAQTIFSLRYPVVGYQAFLTPQKTG